MNSEDFQKIITNAIDSEVESYTFYRSVADRVKDANLKTLFLDLAEDEKGHREYLQGLLLRDVNQMHFVAARDYKITDSIEEPELSVDMKPLDGLVLAIKKELQAAQMYTACRRLRGCRAADGLCPASQIWRRGTRPGSKTSTPTWHTLRRGNRHRPFTSSFLAGRVLPAPAKGDLFSHRDGPGRGRNARVVFKNFGSQMPMSSEDQVIRTGE